MRRQNRELRQKIGLSKAEKSSNSGAVSILRSKLAEKDKELFDLTLQLATLQDEQGKVDKAQFHQLSKQVNTLKMERMAQDDELCDVTKRKKELQKAYKKEQAKNQQLMQRICELQQQIEENHKPRKQTTPHSSEVSNEPRSISSASPPSNSNIQLLNTADRASSEAIVAHQKQHQSPAPSSGLVAIGTALHDAKEDVRHLGTLRRGKKRVRDGERPEIEADWSAYHAAQDEVAMVWRSCSWHSICTLKTVQPPLFFDVQIIEACTHIQLVSWSRAPFTAGEHRNIRASQVILFT